MMRFYRRGLIAILLSAVAAAAPVLGQEASIVRMEGLPRAVTDDGIVVGYWTRESTVEWYHGVYHEPYLWTADEGYRSLPYLPGPGIIFSAMPAAISADGGTVVGDSDLEPVRWTAEGVERLADSGGQAQAVSADGSTIVGDLFPTTGGTLPFRWTQEGGVQMLELPESRFARKGFASGVSSDGEIVVGRALGLDGVWKALRWDADGSVTELDGLGFGSSAALDVSADGRFIVGHSDGPLGWDHATLWHEAFGLQELENFWDYSSSDAFHISDDGAIVAGINSDEGGGGVCVWTDGEAKMVRKFLEEDYGIDMSEWDRIYHIYGLSSDGTKIVGTGYIGEEQVGFLVTLPPPPKIEGEVDDVPDADLTSASNSAAQTKLRNAAGRPKIKDRQVVNARVGSLLELDFTALDPGGDDLRFFAEDVPETATLSPRPGDPVSASFEGTFRWTPTPDDLGTSRLVHLYVRDVEDRRASLRFELRAVSAGAPTVEPIEPVIIECKPGSNVVRLETTVDDAEDDPLSIVWRTNGKFKKSETVAPGSVVAFEQEYSDGETEVELEVSDGGDPVVVGTTVTVQDTTSPIVVAAPRLVVPVDAGELFATIDSLEPPTIEDACDEEPSLRHDAPARLDVGKHVVTWTVEDSSGNVAEAEQTVVVVNELPVADAGKTIRTTTRKFEKRVRLDGRASSDPDRHALTYRWKAEGVRLQNADSPRPIGLFPVGTTKVTLTVTDEGGRRSKAETKVVVRKVAHRRANAAAARVHTTNAYELLVRERQARAFDPVGEAAVQEASAALFLAAQPDEAPDARSDAYAAVRTRQAEHAGRAATLLYDAYLQDGRDETLFAAIEAYRGALFALQDAVE